MNYFLFLAAVFFALLLTAILRRYALAHSLLDVPNARSSHKLATPRGGGMAIVVTFLLGLPLLVGSDVIAWQEMVGLGGAGVLVALVGFMDDLGHIAVRWRLSVHFVASCWALFWIGGLPPLQLFGVVFDVGWLSQVLAALYLVWLLNLYNFMDGIDGLAGVEAVTVCAGAALFCLLVAPGVAAWSPPLLLLAAVAGFLFWNFPPAKIFMGDAGSGFLGLMLGLLSIQAAWLDQALFWAWLVLLGVFVVDATLTLLRRLLRKQKPYEAHRSHAYQYASRKFGAHRPVTLVVGAINLFWLTPLAMLVGLGYVDGFFGVLLAYSPLVWLALRFKAGAAETQEV
ncbi:MAG: glycosyltransferase family 4 protein [Betaproteobacteria bacterium]